jgi:hypothetical protein
MNSLKLILLLLVASIGDVRQATQQSDQSCSFITKYDNVDVIGVLFKHRHG